MKIELAIEWETHELEMRGPQNGDSAGDAIRGSSLNLGLSK